MPQTISEKTKEKKLARTRSLSIKEGVAASVMGGAAESYLMPFALELRASNFVIGLVSALANLVGPLSQLYGSRLMERFSRRRIITFFSTLQATSWLLFIALGLWFLTGQAGEWAVLLFVVFYLLYVVLAWAGGPAWFSLLGDAVPEAIRGRYFARRNRISGVVSVAAMALAAIWLSWSKGHNLVIIGFVALFAVGFVFRHVSARLLARHYVEPIKLPDDYYFSFWSFVRRIPSSNFNKFSAYISLMNLAFNIAGPFFVIYLWKELALDPIWFAAVNISGSVFAFLSVSLWGKFADKYGNRELLRLTSMLMSAAPLFWIFSGQPLYLILVPQLIGGIGSSGFNLAASNFIYDSVTPARRGLCVSYYNLLNGLGVAIGALIGGLIAQSASWSWLNIFFVIFILSAILRFIIYLVFLPRIKEVRAVHFPMSANPFNYLKEIKISTVLDLMPYPLSQKNFWLRLKERLVFSPKKKGGS